MNKIIARLNKRANNLTEERKKFIQECEESGKFNNTQMNQIRLDLANGVTIEDIKTYMNPNFNEIQFV